MQYDTAGLMGWETDPRRAANPLILWGVEIDRSEVLRRLEARPDPLEP